MPRPRMLAAAGFVLAGLVAIAAFAGITVPAIYAKETALWTAQGIGQDWIDLLVVSPALVGCSVGIRRGSRGALLVFAGALIYLLYSFVLYALAVHFNALFLVYVATLGVSFYALVGVATHLVQESAGSWFGGPPPFARTGGVFLIVVASAFALLWLSAVVPALIAGTSPAGLDEVGLVTNPIYVIDLAVVLPALLIGGVLLVRRRAAGFVLGPILLGFNALMTAALIGMFLAMWARGLPSDLSVAAVTAVLCGASLVLLRGLVRPLRISAEAVS